MQFLANIIDAPVDRPKMLETTALGAAWLAGMYTKFYPDKDEFSENWAVDKRFEPRMNGEERDMKIKGWELAIRRTLLK